MDRLRSDRLYLMGVFTAVAEAESFASGARRLKMSPPAVTRAIAALEARLGVTLLHRTTRLVRVTEAGQRYLEDARRILREVDEADESAAGINSQPRGHLSVTAPVLFGRMHVTPNIVAYLQRYPEVNVSALFVDRVVNLLEEGLDVGIRIGELPDSSMKAISAGHVRRVVCASPAYLKQHGTPKLPADLSRHVVVLASSVSPAIDWRFTSESKTTTVRARPRLTVTSNEAAIEAVRRGFGITRLLSYQVAPYVASGELKIVLDQFEPPRLPIHILHREGRHASARVRTFVDLMVANLRSDKSLR